VEVSDFNAGEALPRLGNYVKRFSKRKQNIFKQAHPKRK
jgi:hypothetical protein